MHLMIPHAAALDAACVQTLATVGWRTLPELLARLAPAQRLGGDVFDPIPPHERALAAAWGWPGDAPPFAAQAAAADGIAVGERAWGLLTPVHWHVGRDHVTLTDPDALALGAPESRALFDAVRPLFEDDGFALAWGAPQRWYVAHDSLDGLVCASLDRVVARNVDRWMPEGDRARTIRRLQSEVQMALHAHPVNAAREERGALPVNSFWLSGCGRFRPADEAAVRVDDRLRAPLFEQDWAAYADAWRALDAGPLADCLQQLQRGEAVVLTLAGERHAQRFEAAPRSAWASLLRRWRRVDPAPMLEAL